MKNEIIRDWVPMVRADFEKDLSQYELKFRFSYTRDGEIKKDDCILRGIKNGNISRSDFIQSGMYSLSYPLKERCIKQILGYSAFKSVLIFLRIYDDSLMIKSLGIR